MNTKPSKTNLKKQDLPLWNFSIQIGGEGGLYTGYQSSASKGTALLTLPVNNNLHTLERTSQNVNDIDCVKLIWWHFYQMYRILRKDTAQPKPECTIGSTNVEDYEFGLSDAEIVRYVHQANMFHFLMIFRYGDDFLTRRSENTKKKPMSSIWKGDKGDVKFERKQKRTSGEKSSEKRLLKLSLG